MMQMYLSGISFLCFEHTHLARFTAGPSDQTPEQMSEIVRSWDEVEWGWQHVPLVHVLHPHTGSRKLPLDISIVLM